MSSFKLNFAPVINYKITENINEAEQTNLFDECGEIFQTSAMHVSIDNGCDPRLSTKICIKAPQTWLDAFW